ncbi:MAG TPA: helix-turn-helix domain-containing protein [Nitrosomonas sp.]|jgi:transcriptional regulator with XRE-family HTH domain|uniref:Xre family transcriptional regulator n=1 Tax=Nitrosomonas ureae TaxID=44577 RepID=A0A2T5ITV6_9PROT|nr:helix-turn-helix domain-containing protein [Nitrosomonas ureae]HMW20070.1 helix-turn-helix domain-containing protein [Nitrosomonas sp.]PTQ87312.1 Xre family transcriptional regulator [Nitrosomonas ureae]PXX16093.1 helix-turn-helix protein [Nitrosomonas ureae]HMW70059.1 helix-turn-helix domain-containing protein [Nitrosomonas sp.]HNE58923.1 helix-turn-helix domain-containing protein [Nitrosomonas sp.]
MYNLILITNILRILDEKGVTKSELAKKAGVSIAFFTDLTNDKANPSLRIMEAIAEALETPLPMLLDSSDMNAVDLEALANRKLKRLPKGFVWKGGVLSEFEAYQVEQWDKKNRAFLLKNKSKK